MCFQIGRMNRDKFLKSFAQHTSGMVVDAGKFSKNENLFAGIIQATCFIALVLESWLGSWTELLLFKCVAERMLFCCAIFKIVQAMLVALADILRYDFAAFAELNMFAALPHQKAPSVEMFLGK